MIELYFSLLVLFSLGTIYGFYDLVYRWLKPKADRMTKKLKRLIPKMPKPKLRTTSPQDIVSEVHANHSSPVALPPVFQSARAAQLQRSLHEAENELFWNQVARECKRVAGHTDFRSYDPDRGKK